VGSRTLEQVLIETIKNAENAPSVCGTHFTRPKISVTTEDGIFTLHKICASTKNGTLQVRFLNKKAGTVLWRDIMFYFIGGTFFIEEPDV